MSTAIQPAATLSQTVEDDITVLALEGHWQLVNLRAIEAAIGELHLDASRAAVLDGTRLRSLDTSAGFTLVRALALAGFQASTVRFRGLQEDHRRLLALVHERMATPPSHPQVASRGLANHMGRATLRVVRQLRVHNSFLGRVAVHTAQVIRRPRLFRVNEALSQFEAVTLNAIPIIALVTFLIGVVFAYLLGTQARRYGATIFVVDGVGLAICRELSPMLAAIIVAGRSGAAFTAQLGSMKVQEETAAIQTLGLSPIQVLVIPRLVAIVVGLPLLVFVGDVAGVAGGVLISSLQLDISATAFLTRLHSVLPLSAVVIGLAKAPVFAAFIALIACRMGLSVERDSRSVGEHTTSTVVQGIVWVIVLDAAFAVALQHAGV